MIRPNRLRAARDFERLRAQGRSWGHPLLTLHALRTGGDASRFGFVVSGRVGPAVTRNRVRRRLREVVRALLPRVDPGWDVSISARSRAALVDFAALRRAVEEALSRAKVLRP